MTMRASTPDRRECIWGGLGTFLRWATRTLSAPCQQLSRTIPWITTHHRAANTLVGMTPARPAGLEHAWPTCSGADVPLPPDSRAQASGGLQGQLE
jgi:hypothetical protein